LELSIGSLCKHGEMPVKLSQLSLVPQAQDEAQPRLEHTQSGLADIIHKLVLAGGNLKQIAEQAGVSPSTNVDG
jgi:hypothetical protein